MSLTGIPLVVVAALCTVAVVAATVLLWNRFGRVRYLVRVAGVLTAEVLLMATFGLVVNRSEEFYPTWSTLMDAKTGDDTTVKATNATTHRSAAGDLDRRLVARAGGRTADALSFPWQSADWRGWGLADTPTVITPAGYLTHPGWAYSAVVVIGEGRAGWSAAEEESIARRAGATGASAVVVFATTTGATTAQTLAVTVPDQLSRDLRVTSHRWALVAAAADAALAQRAAVAAAARYPSIAIVSADDHGAGAAGTAATSPTNPVLPAGVTLAVVVGDTPAPHQAGVVSLPSTARNALYTALSWAVGRIPPPLGGHDGRPRG